MKVLIIRFSSFGDIIQCLGVPSALKAAHPNAEIHWVVRVDFAELLEHHPAIHKVWSLDRKAGLKGLLSLSQDLKAQGFTHIYDAHNNLRSHILSGRLSGPQFARRPKHRFKRFLLFKLGKNYFESPFVAQKSYLSPLTHWIKSSEIPSAPQLFLSPKSYEGANRATLGLKNYVTIAPVTAWKMKNWPLEHWKTLLLTLQNNTCVILGGPKDMECFALESELRENGIPVKNLAGKLSLTESAAVVARSQLLISADTGLLHVADQLGTPAIALIGPTAFGYPSRPTTKILEVALDCKPCTKDGRGACRNAIYQKCMVDITPEMVKSSAKKMGIEFSR